MVKNKDGKFIMDEYMITPSTKCIECKFLGEPKGKGLTCYKYPEKIPGSIWKSGKCTHYVFEKKEIDDTDLPELLFDED